MTPFGNTDQSAPGIIIVGAGGHARVAAEVAELCGYSLIGLFAQDQPDDSWGLSRYLGPVGAINDKVAESVAIHVAIGNNSARQKLLDQFLRAGRHTPALVHPSAVISARSSLGAGSLVAARAVVGVGAQIGTGVIVNTGATVDHDCVIGDWVHLAPGTTLCGTVSIGRGTFVGAGATILPGVTVGENATIGAGAAVTRAVTTSVTVVGVPARPLPPK